MPLACALARAERNMAEAFGGRRFRDLPTASDRFSKLLPETHVCVAPCENDSLLRYELQAVVASAAPRLAG